MTREQHQSCPKDGDTKQGLISAKTYPMKYAYLRLINGRNHLDNPHNINILYTSMARSIYIYIAQKLKLHI